MLQQRGIQPSRFGFAQGQPLCKVIFPDVLFE
jgi:hypothetical protein